jgi:hypothetical protein
MPSLRECVAEAAGVFFYVFPGIAAITSFTVNTTGELPVPFYGNILQVGFAFALVRNLGIKQVNQSANPVGHCLRNHHVRTGVWWSFQSRRHDFLCCLARLSVEEGSALHPQPDLRIVYGGSRPDGVLLATTLSLKRCQY